MTKEKYFEKLKDPRWQKMRLRVLERDGFKCQKCFNGELTLHIHHRRYVGNRDPWDYPISSLVTLCETCHLEEKETIKDYCEQLVEIVKEIFFADDIQKLATAFNDMRVGYDPEVVVSIIGWVLTSDRNFENLAKLYFSDTEELEK